MAQLQGLLGPLYSEWAVLCGFNHLIHLRILLCTVPSVVFLVSTWSVHVMCQGPWEASGFQGTQYGPYCWGSHKRQMSKQIVTILWNFFGWGNVGIKQKFLNYMYNIYLIFLELHYEVSGRAVCFHCFLFWALHTIFFLKLTHHV